MPCDKCNLGTPEQETKFRGIMSALKNTPGAVMPAMQQAQELYGYLPFGVQKFIAEELSAPLEEIYGIATFYSQFTLQQKGKHTVSVCLGTACYVKGSAVVLESVEKLVGAKAGQTTADGKFSVDATRCLGCCGLAPVLSVDGRVYGKVAPEQVKGILAEYQK